MPANSLHEEGRCPKRCNTFLSEGIPLRVLASFFYQEGTALRFWLLSSSRPRTWGKRRRKEIKNLIDALARLVFMEYHSPGDVNKWRSFLISPGSDSRTEKGRGSGDIRSFVVSLLIWALIPL